MSIRKLQTSDLIRTGLREKYNETVDAIPVSFTDNGDGTGFFNLFGGQKIQVNFGLSFGNFGSFNPATILRSQGNVQCNAVEEQILFSSPLPNANYSLQIFDKEQLGIEWISQDQNGFTIHSLNPGLFSYFAIINI